MDDQTLLNILNFITALTLLGFVIISSIEAYLERKKALTKEEKKNLNLKYLSITFGIISIFTFFGSWIISNRISEEENRKFETFKLQVDTMKINLTSELSKNKKETALANFKSDSLRKSTTELEKQNKLLDLNLSQVLLHSVNKTQSISQGFDIYFENENQIDEYTYEFDVYIKSTDLEFEISSYQIVIDFIWSSEITNDFSIKYIKGSSVFKNTPTTRINELIENFQILIASSKLMNDAITVKRKRIGKFRFHSISPFSGAALNFKLNYAENVGTILVSSSYLLISNQSLITAASTNVTSEVIVDTQSFKGSGIVTNLKVFLEGAYAGSNMQSTLNEYGLIPLSQPYNISPWNYFGTENIIKIPEDIVDWVLIELRKTLDVRTIIAKRAALITTNGIIVDLDGKSKVAFNSIKEGNYFVVVKHRNHLPIMSSNPITLSMGSELYDFTNDKNKAYGSDMAALNKFFAMYSGDGDGNGVINVLDYGSISNNLFKTGYYLGDLDMNGTINIIDLSKTNLNLLKQTKVPL